MDFPHALQSYHRHSLNFVLLTSFGIFRLTEPSGLSAIIQCKRSALFHEHPDVDGGIYTDADGGHVRLTSGGGVEVIDLRRK